MDMSGADIRKYPDLWAWLRWQFPFLPSRKPKVWEAFKRHAPWYGYGYGYGYPYFGEDEVSFEASFYSFLRPGLPPTIEVNSTDFMECAEDGEEQLQKDGSYVQNRIVRWYGFTVPRYGADKILIAADLAQTVFGPQSQILEATVLHELVHWCRLKSFITNYEDEGPPYAFEKEAYGRVQLRTWNTCFSPAYFKVQ